MRKYTQRLEASVTHSILTQLMNLGWIVDEKNPACNVTQQRPKTETERHLLKGNLPDFVLYQSDTNRPIAVIEAKRPGESLTKALDDAQRKYAKPLETPLIFAYNDTYVATRYLGNGRPLKIDGEDVRQFVNHYTALRFVNEGPEIFSAPQQVQLSREQLITIFRRAADLLREAGLQAGLERFGAFSDILFLKLMDEVCELRLHAGLPSPLPNPIRWSHFQPMGKEERHTYLRDVVWKAMNKKYETIFSESMPIDSPEILHDIVEELSSLNLTSADTDVKGDAFEYFLKNAYQGVSIKDLGEYFTPRNIVRTMISMVNPRFGETIYDPFCGTGGFLIESFKYIRLRTKSDAEIDAQLKNKTVYGVELTTNARIAKMNMILAGDGHSNIVKQDSFQNPRNGLYDIVLTNPPYSQKTRYGNLYPVASSSGDAVAMLHCFESLNDSGRAAILVKEDFLSEGGDVGKVREYILERAKNFSVVSLPRKLFEPYTPTKTSIIYLEKSGKRATTYFYVVRHVGHTLTSRKRSIRQNDLPVMLDAFNERTESHEVESCIVENDLIAKRNQSLWVYDYIELVPDSPFEMNYLGKYIEESGEVVSPKDDPDREFTILGVSNRHGVFENKVLTGANIKQKYIRVTAGDLTYNPHRVNVGSIGLVTQEDEGGYVSGIYVVFRSKEPKEMPPNYLLWLLKSPPYKQVIEAYDTKHGAVRANLTFDQLCRIKIPIIKGEAMKKFTKKQEDVESAKHSHEKAQKSVADYLETITSSNVNIHRLEDFNTVLQLAVQGERERR